MIVSLTPRTDFAPVPRVEILIEPLSVVDGGSPSGTGPVLDGGSPSDTGQLVDGGSAAMTLVDVPAGTDRVTLWRRTGGRALKVRGVVDRVFTGTAGFQDFEAGFDVESSYELECFDGDTNLGRVSVGSTVLPRFGELHDVLIQQPLDPHFNAVLEATWDQAGTVERSAPGAVVAVEGVSLPSMVAAGVRGGVSAQLTMTAVDRVRAASVWGTLGSDERPMVPVWLVRGVHPLLPPVLFCDARTVRETSVDLHLGGVVSLFTVDTTEVAPPAPALVISPLSYTDLDVSFPGYDEMDAAFASYDERDTAWEYAGASGGS